MLADSQRLSMETNPAIETSETSSAQAKYDLLPYYNQILKAYSSTHRKTSHQDLKHIKM